MNIIKNSIHDFSAEFNEFRDTLERCNYVPVFDGTYFEYEGSDIFTINNLIDLYISDDPNADKVKGLVKPSNYQEAKQKIRYGLRFDSEDGIQLSDSNEPLVKKREKIYWSIVNKHFSYKPLAVFAHDPCPKSYFGHYVMWHFVYIFLRAGKGVVLAGQAWD